mgnify:CR=1 FL=1
MRPIHTACDHDFFQNETRVSSFLFGLPAWIGSTPNLHTSYVSSLRHRRHNEGRRRRNGWRERRPHQPREVESSVTGTGRRRDQQCSRPHAGAFRRSDPIAVWPWHPIRMRFHPPAIRRRRHQSRRHWRWLRDFRFHGAARYGQRNARHSNAGWGQPPIVRQPPVLHRRACYLVGKRGCQRFRAHVSSSGGRALKHPSFDETPHSRHVAA